MAGWTNKLIANSVKMGLQIPLPHCEGDKTGVERLWKWSLMRIHTTREQAAFEKRIQRHRALAESVFHR